MTQYYFDYVAGLDANDGLTLGTPKKTLGAIPALVLTDNTISLKRGVVWPYDGGPFGDANLEILAKNPAGGCTINDYGSAVDPPIIDCLDYQTVDGTWAHAGSGRWTMSYASAVHRIMFGGSSSTLSIGGLSWKGSSSTDVTNQWWWSAGTLHIFTGSTTVSPPVFYGGIALISAARQDAIRIKNSSNLTFERIRTLGGQVAGWDFVATTQHQEQILLTDCESKWTGINSGFRIRSTSTTYRNRDITLTRPVYDMKTDATEDEGSSVRVGGSDGINITHSYDDIEIIDPTVTRCRHAGINCYDEVGYLPGVVVIRAGPSYGVFDQGVVEYGRGLNLIGSAAGAAVGMDVRCSGIKVSGSNTANQFSGKLVVSGCTFKDHRWTFINGFNTAYAVSFQSWNLGPGNSDMVDVTFQNNYIEDCWLAPIRLAKQSIRAGNFDANTVKIYNNVIVDVAHYGYDSHKAIQTTEMGYGAPAFQLVKNNNIITPVASGGTQVSWDSVLYTVNAVTGFTGNLENVEGLVNRAGGDYHPTALGGLKFAGVLGAAGAMDTNGIAFNGIPSIAPSEYVSSFSASIRTMGINLPPLSEALFK